jgi:hypothetical protein
VGTVKDVEFFGASQVRVTMTIDKRVQEYIRSDAKARDRVRRIDRK